MPPENEQTEQTEQVLDYEKIAREDGWCPKEEWRGDPTRWFDAKTFVERGATILPVVQAKYRKTLETVGELQKTVEELKEGNRLFGEFHEKTLSRERKEHAEKLAALEVERAKAITDGDGQTFTIKDRQIREMQQQPVQKPPDTLPPATQAWLNDNAWYQTDPTLRSIADGLSDLVAKENPGLKGRAFLDKLTEKVQAEVPHKFKNSRRDEQVTEEHTRKVPTGSKAKSFENLPEAAKAACSKFERTIPGFTKEKYLSQYDWSEQ